jgi:hypothetical protein
MLGMIFLKCAVFDPIDLNGSCQLQLSKIGSGILNFNDFLNIACLVLNRRDLDTVTVVNFGSLKYKILRNLIFNLLFLNTDKVHLYPSSFSLYSTINC